MFVNLDAATLSPGATTWNKKGTYTDFIADGTPVVTLDPIPAVYFDGRSAFRGTQAAPAGLTGLDPTRSIEVWAWNPGIASEETLVAWGHRGGGDGTNMSFNFGNNGYYGAVGHWGNPDLGWIDNNATPGPPTAGEWHHLVYTYDGEFARVYADGELSNEEDMIGYGGLNTHADTGIAIASQWDNATTLTAALGAPCSSIGCVSTKRP